MFAEFDREISPDKLNLAKLVEVAGGGERNRWLSKARCDDSPYSYGGL
jgi:hypothetical protein